MTVTFRDIKADVLARIMRGEWAPGDNLPNEADLAQSYACARTTVNRALRELAEEGYIDRRRKAGTRVRQSPLRQARFEIPLVRREIEEQGAAYRHALVEREISAAPDWLRARMHLNDAARVLHLICIHYADGNPYQHEDRWINLANLPQAAEADFAREGPNEWLVRTVPFSDVEISFSARSATEALAAHLACTPGDALFRVERSTWFGGAPVTYVQLCHRPGHRMTTRY